MLSYLRMIAYRDDLSFLRIINLPKRNIGKRRIKFLQEYAEKNQCLLYDALKRNLEDEIFKGTKAESFIKLIESYNDCGQIPVSELMSDILNKSGYEKMLRTEGSGERLDNLAELKQSIYEYETSCGEECTLEHYLAHVALFTNTDAEAAPDKVKLMTVHTAKGLEFPIVFLCGMNEGIFPSKKINTLESMEEERRLAFVAMTRAKERLYITEAAGRNFDGSQRYPSRFIFDIDPGLLEFVNKPEDVFIDDALGHIEVSTKYLVSDEEIKGFAKGQRVFHSVFGKGTVLDTDSAKGAHIVQFDDIDTPRAITFRAKLEKC